MTEQFTYESGERTDKLETYEWDNLWWEHADDFEKERILIIGDSISCGYRGFVNELLAGKIYADGLGTSKAADNPTYYTLLKYMQQQYPDYKLIQINFGLHGWHLDTQSYEKEFLKLTKYVKSLFPKAQIAVALTTPVRNPKNHDEYGERTPIIKERNAALCRVSEKVGAKVIDLWSVLENRCDIYREDGVHLQEDGYRMLAARCVEFYKNQRGILE